MGFIQNLSTTEPSSFVLLVAVKRLLLPAHPTEPWTFDPRCLAAALVALSPRRLITPKRKPPGELCFRIFRVAKSQQAAFFAGLAMKRSYFLCQVRLGNRFGQPWQRCKVWRRFGKAGRK